MQGFYLQQSIFVTCVIYTVSGVKALRTSVCDRYLCRGVALRQTLGGAGVAVAAASVPVVRFVFIALRFLFRQTTDQFTLS